MDTVFVHTESKCVSICNAAKQIYSWSDRFVMIGKIFYYTSQTKEFFTTLFKPKNNQKNETQRGISIKEI